MTTVLNALGGLLMWAVGLVALVTLAAAFFWGAEWASIHLFEPAATASGWLFWICLLILLPLAIFRRTRLVACYGLFIASFIFGATIWMAGFLTTLDYWGVGAVFVGLFMMGVGVVPMAILAALFQAPWWVAGVLTLGLVVTYGCRMLALTLAASLDRQPKPRRQKVSLGVATVFD